jgi:hypothetical protein
MGEVVMPVISATQQAEVGESWSRLNPGQNLEILPEKYQKQKRAGGVAQMVEHLPSNCEIPSLNPRIAKQLKFQSD